MDPNQNQISPVSPPILQPQEPIKKDGVIAIATSSVANYGHKHSFQIVMLIKKMVMWLINLIRFVIMQVISQVFNRN